MLLKMQLSVFQITSSNCPLLPSYFFLKQLEKDCKSLILWNENIVLQVDPSSEVFLET